MTAHSELAPVLRVTNEKGVKRHVRDLLQAHGWFAWMPAANGYGRQGLSDFCAIKNGVFLAVETKFGSNKPTAVQTIFAKEIVNQNGFAFCVNEKNFFHLKGWLESFETATQQQMRGAEVSPEDGSRMLNAMNALMDLYK